MEVGKQDKAIQMLRDNVPTGEIVEATGYSRDYLYILAKRKQITRKRITIGDYGDQILYMMEQGKSFSEIGNAIGYSPVTVKNYIVAYKHRMKKAETEETIEDIAFPERQLSFVKPKKVKIYRVTYFGVKYLDVSERYIPR